MRFIFGWFLVLIFCVQGVDARPRHWYTDWHWWAGEAVIVGAVIADGRSTCQGFSRGLVEGNPLDRGAHNCGSAAGMLAVGGSIYTVLHIESYRILQNDESRAWRGLSLVTIPAIACAFHCTAAVNNFHKDAAR
jgi:hypothetical protein